MPSPHVPPWLPLLTRTKLGRSGCGRNPRISQLSNRSWRGSCKTANHDIYSRHQFPKRVADTMGGQKSTVQSGLQRRGYHQYNIYPPMSFWQRNKPSIVIAGTIGLCSICYVGSWWAQQRAENIHDHEPLNFIRENFVCSLENVRAGRYWVLLSCSITHFEIWHLGANMVSLWYIGQSVVAYFGAPAFFGLWISSSLCCSAASLWWDQRREAARINGTGRKWDNRAPEQRRWFVPKDSADPGIMYGGSIGASGALMGTLGAMACFMPNSSIMLLPIPIRFRMWMYTAAFAGWSLYCLDSGTLPRIGHAGHLGGLVGGLASYYGVIRPWLHRLPRF